MEAYIKILPIDTYQRMKVALAALKIPKSVIDHVDWNDLGVHNKGGYWFLPAKANREEVTRLPKGVNEQFVKVLVEKIGTGRENEGIKVKKFKIHVKDGARYGYIHADDLKGPGLGDVPNAYLDATMEAPRNRSESVSVAGAGGIDDYAITEVKAGEYRVDMPGGKAMPFNNLGQAIVFVRRDQATGHHYGTVIVTNAKGETKTLIPAIHSPNGAKMSKANWDAYWAAAGKKARAFFKGGKKGKKNDAVPRVIVVPFGGVEIHPGPKFQTATVSADKSAHERWGKNADSTIQTALANETRDAKWEVTFKGIKGDSAHWTAKRVSPIPRKKKNASDGKFSPGTKVKASDDDYLIYEGRDGKVHLKTYAGESFVFKTSTPAFHKTIELQERTDEGLRKVTFRFLTGKTVVFDLAKASKDAAEHERMVKLTKKGNMAVEAGSKKALGGWAKDAKADAIREWLGFKEHASSDEETWWFLEENGWAWMVQETDMWASSGEKSGKKYSINMLEMDVDVLNTFEKMSELLDTLDISGEKWAADPLGEKMYLYMQSGEDNEFIGDYNSLNAAWRAIRQRLHPHMIFDSNEAKPSTSKKAKKPAVVAERMAKVAKILVKLQHATPATQEGLENELKVYIYPSDYGVESIQELLYDPEGAAARNKLSKKAGVAMSVFDDIQNVGKGNEAKDTPRRPRAPKGWKWQSPLILVRVAEQDWEMDPKGSKPLKDAYVEAAEYEDDKWEIVNYDPSPAGGHSAGKKMSTKATSVFPAKVRVQREMVEIARGYEEFLEKKRAR